MIEIPIPGEIFFRHVLMNYNRLLTPFVFILFLLSGCTIWTLYSRFPLPHFYHIVIFTILLFILTVFKIKIPRVNLEVSITWPVAFFGIWLLGPWMGLSLMSAILLYIVIYFILPQIREDWRLFQQYFMDYLLSTIFNVSYCCLITCVPGIIYCSLAGSSTFEYITLPHLGAMIISAVTCFLISFAATNTRIALFENREPWKMYIDPRGELMELSLVSLSIAALVIYGTLGPFYLLLIIIPAGLTLYLLGFGLRAATEKDDISLLYDFATLITSALNFETTIDNICSGVMRSIQAEGCAILLKDRESGRYQANLRLGSLAKLDLQLSSEDSGEISAFLSSIRSTVTDFTESEWLRENYFPEISSEISVALISEKKNVTGFILLTRNQFERDHRSFLGILASQAGTALSNASLYLQALETNRQLRMTQAQLVQSSKMTAVGQLASGVALRLSAPFRNILNNFNVISKNAGSGEKLEKRLKISQQAIVRCVDIHEKLYHYTQKSETREEDIQVWALIDSAVEFIQKLLEHDNIKIIKKREEVPTYRGNPDHIHQILTNLILNSRDALVGSSAETRKIIITACEKEGALIISVEDNGMGILKEVRERIFDPFYTTKDIGKGTGLGLSVSLEIAKKSGGTISVSSEPGQGATFTVKLPYSASLKL